MRRSLAGILVLLAVSLRGSSIVTQWEGLSEQVQQTHITNPPDPGGAAGPAGVIQTTRTSVSYYDKTGALIWGFVNAVTFFSNAGATNGFDTRSLYDTASGRFYVVMPENNSLLVKAFLNLAVSKNSNPQTSGTNDWYFYHVDVTETVSGTAYGLDYSAMGVDSQAFYATYNMFRSGAFLNVQIIIFDKAAINSGTAVPLSVFTPGGNPAATSAENATHGFSLQPATPLGATSPGNVAFFAETPYYSTNSVRIWALSDPLGAATLTSATLTVPDNGDQPASNINATTTAPQVGTSIRLQTLSHYTQGNAFWHSGSIWFCQTAGGSSGRDLVYYYKVSANSFPASGSPSLAESGAIDGGSGEWTYQPAIGGNAVGDVCLVYTQSSASRVPTIMYTARAAGAGSFEAPTQLKVSPNFYNGTVGTFGARWGDFGTVSADPVDGTLWISHEWAKTAAANSWGTWWGQVSLPSTIPSNNTFASSTTISGASGSVGGYNFYCSKEAGEPNHAGNTGGKSVWWQWTAPASGTAAFNTSGSSFDTLLGIYTGVSVNTLTTIASNNNFGGPQSAVTFSAVSGTTYFVAVDGASAAAGTVSLNWSLNIPPSVNLTSPANNAKFNAPATITITASAFDGDGSISQVEFDEGLAVLWVGTTNPYTFDWKGVAAGTYSITAFAIDNLGASSVAGPVNVMVNALPTISVIADRTIVQDTSTVVLEFNVSDAETAVENLTMSGVSSDPALVPNTNIIFGGSGAARTVTVTPLASQVGTSTITLTVNDADGGSASISFVLTVLADTDHDGMPDVWENSYGLDPNNASDASIDSDGDGYTNLQEYLAGTSPLDPASALRITTTLASGNDLSISFTTVVAKSYRLERNDSFPTGAWIAVATGITGTGGGVSIVDSGAGSLLHPTYRVVLLP